MWLRFQEKKIIFEQEVDHVVFVCKDSSFFYIDYFVEYIKHDPIFHGLQSWLGHHCQLKKDPSCFNHKPSPHVCESLEVLSNLKSLSSLEGNKSIAGFLKLYTFKSCK
jgi:hypothetical protein